MVEDQTCALPLSGELPPPYTDPQILSCTDVILPPPPPPYVEFSILPPPPYENPSKLFSSQKHCQSKQCTKSFYANLWEALDRSVSHLLLQLDSRLALKILALCEVTSAVLMLICSSLTLTVYQHYYYYYYVDEFCDEHYGLFIGIFNIVLTSGFAFVVVGFPWCRKSPVKFSKTSTNEILVRIYLLCLGISFFCGGSLVGLLALKKDTFSFDQYWLSISIYRICLMIAAIYNSKFKNVQYFHLLTLFIFVLSVIFSFTSAMIILWKKPMEIPVVNTTAVHQVAPAVLAVENNYDVPMVFYCNRSDTAIIIPSK